MAEKVKVQFKSGKTIETTREEFAKIRNIFPSAKIVQVVKAKPPIPKAAPVEKVTATAPKAEFVTDATAPGILDYETE